MAFSEQELAVVGFDPVGFYSGPRLFAEAWKRGILASELYLSALI